MIKRSMFLRPTLMTSLTLAAVLLAAVGCGAPEAQFKLNRPFILKTETEAGAQLGDRTEDVADILAAMFGTPDAPHVPALPEFDTSTVLNINRLDMAAGPVESDQQGNPRGLYREHCAHCHGITGDGLGPTAAFLNPYPRDYRKGQYKFKSTPIGSRPTHDDLRRILTEGIPGTAMPSFKLLPADELDALVHYVKYLSIRGEVERALVTNTLSELDESDRLIDLKLKEASDDEQQELFAGQLALIKDVANTSFEAWARADSQVTP